MALPDEMAEDLAELESELGAVFTWNSAEYPCVNGSTSRRKGLDSGGYGLDADLVLYVRTEHFADADSRPQLKNPVTFESRSYRIEEIVVPPGSAFMKLVCSEPNRGL